MNILKYREGVCVEFEEKECEEYFGEEGEEEEVVTSFESTDDIKQNGYFEKLEIESKDHKDIKTYRYFPHGLLDSLHNAFINHYGIELKPDNFWLLVCQAISIHEEVTGILGKLFDLPNPPKEIEVRDDTFIKGEHNDWDRVFPQFEEGIKENIPETLYNLLSNKKYSTTTKMDQICNSICLMDSMKKYFSFTCSTACQIPRIYIRGTKEDWEGLYMNIKSLSQLKLELDWWFPSIMNIIEHFVGLYDGKKDDEFWSSIYKYREESGGDKVNGWICCFFPYNYRMKGEDYIPGKWRKKQVGEDLGNWRRTRSVKPEKFPEGVNSVPFKWNYLGEEFDYKIYSGFLGVEQIPDEELERGEYLAKYVKDAEEEKEVNDSLKEENLIKKRRVILRPRLGWAVGPYKPFRLEDQTEEWKRYYKWEMEARAQWKKYEDEELEKRRKENPDYDPDEESSCDELLEEEGETEEEF